MTRLRSPAKPPVDLRDILRALFSSSRSSNVFLRQPSRPSRFDPLQLHRFHADYVLRIVYPP